MVSSIVVVRASEIADFRQCPLKRHLNWNELWAKPEESAPSTLGTAWHHVMAAHYLGIQKLQRQEENLRLSEAAKQTVLDQVDALIETFADEIRDTLDWMYEGHLEKYGFNDGWEILHAEETLTTPMRERSGRASRFHYRWTSDLVIRDWTTVSKSIYVIDHKSTAQSLRQDEIDLMDSIGMYVWAWRQKKLDVLAPVIMQAHTKKLKRAMVLSERYAWLPSYRTDVELANIAREALQISKAMNTKAMMAEPYSAPDPRTCSWKCDFREAHLALRKMANPDQHVDSLLRSRGFVRREAVPSGTPAPAV